MSQRDWRTYALHLREENPERSIASIAREVGITYSSVWGVFNPERRGEQRQRDNTKRAKAKRAWENENDRGTCERCGATTCVGHNRKSAGRWCAECYAAIRRHDRLQRARKIERLWAAGVTIKEIAAALDTTPEFMAVEITRLRREGLADLPYRYAMENGRRRAA